MSSYRYLGRCLLIFCWWRFGPYLVRPASSLRVALGPYQERPAFTYHATGKRAQLIHAIGSRYSFYHSVRSRASKLKTTLGAVNRLRSAVVLAADPFFDYGGRGAMSSYRY